MPTEHEFTERQTERIDEVENAVYDMCRVLTEEDDLEWNMEFIGEIADLACMVLSGCGYKIRYPALVTDFNGNEKIVDYIPAETKEP